MSEAIDFYHGKNILITGAAGFLGKLLVEKLLRLCNVGKIYILIRDKRGLKAEQRLDTIFQLPVFDRLRQMKPNFLNFVKLVSGDVSLPGLGLSEDTREFLIKEIDIVFHVAASVNFQDPIKRATAVNVYGTKEMVLLCQNIKHLKALVFVSTAYSNCIREEISEQFYTPPLKADELLILFENLSDEELTNSTAKYLEGWPNTYTFSKCLAEDVIKTQAVGIPTCVVRPGVVACTRSEPIEGWIDNFYGPGGYIAGILAAQIRLGHLDEKALLPLVPADLCINVMIAACYLTSKSGFEREVKIYNVTSAAPNKLTIGKFFDCALKGCEQTPSAKAIWRPRLLLIKSNTIYAFLSFIYHLLPALLIDVTSAICFKRTKALKAYRNSEKFIKALTFFGSRSWIFSEDNVRSLWNKLNPADIALLGVDVNHMDWEEMIVLKVRGVRKFLLKEHEDTIPMAKKKMYLFIGINWTLHASIILLASIFVVKYFSTVEFII